MPGPELLVSSLPDEDTGLVRPAVRYGKNGGYLDTIRGL